MRAPLASTALLASLVVLAPLGPTAHAAAPADWRAIACAEQDGDLAVGAYSVAHAQTQRVEQIPSLTLTAEHLVFANGARCDLLSLDGRVVGGAELTGHGSEMTLMGETVVGGVNQGEIEGDGSMSGSGSSAPIPRVRHQVLGAMVFLDVESGTVTDAPWIPESWRNQPYTVTHTRTTFTATVNGREAHQKTFTVTKATRAAAERRLTKALAAADTAAERKAARTTHRLALRGVRLVMKRFRHDWSGELPR